MNATLTIMLWVISVGAGIGIGIVASFFFIDILKRRKKLK